MRRCTMTVLSALSRLYLWIAAIRNFSTALQGENVMTTDIWLASGTFWRKAAIWVTAGSFVVLVFLTFDSMSQITVGTKRVPAYSAINHRIEYQFDERRHVQAPMNRCSARDSPSRKR